MMITEIITFNFMFHHENQTSIIPLNQLTICSFNGRSGSVGSFCNLWDSCRKWWWAWTFFCRVDCESLDSFQGFVRQECAPRFSSSPGPVHNSPNTTKSLFHLVSCLAATSFNLESSFDTKAHCWCLSRNSFSLSCHAASSSGPSIRRYSKC